MAVKSPPPSCLNCKWRLDLSDCGNGTQDDICECPKCEVVNNDGSRTQAKIRCSDHRRHGNLYSRLFGYCGRQGEWFEGRIP